MFLGAVFLGAALFLALAIDFSILLCAGDFAVTFEDAALGVGVVLVGIVLTSFLEIICLRPAVCPGGTAGSVRRSFR